MQGITNWGTALWASLTTVMGNVFAFIPKLIGFLVILFIGWLVAKGLEKAMTYLLRRVGFERLSQRIGLAGLEQRMNVHMDASGLLGRIVFWFVFLIFLIPAIDALGLSSISALLGQLIAYIPNIFVAVIVLFLGMLIATLVADVIRGALSGGRVGNPNIFANIARYSIIGFAALIALDQLGIAPVLLSILFTAIMGGMALAFGLAFGLGGREAAQRWLARGESSLSQVRTTDPRIQAQQSPEQVRASGQPYASAQQPAQPFNKPTTS